MKSRSVKTEAVVLRSMRYGEADRILHLYTPHRGRVGAIAKGVRRARSRFGGRLEPFFRLRIELHEGRGELLTVTGADTVDAHARLRGDARALDAAARACEGRARDRAHARAPRAPAAHPRDRPRVATGAPRLRRVRDVSWSESWTRVTRSHTRCSRKACRCTPPTAGRWAPCTTSSPRR